MMNIYDGLYDIIGKEGREREGKILSVAVCLVEGGVVLRLWMDGWMDGRVSCMRGFLS